MTETQRRAAAKQFAAELPYSQRPRWIVTCNFAAFPYVNGGLFADENEDVSKTNGKDLFVVHPIAIYYGE